MSISNLVANLGKTIKVNSPGILSAFGIVGVATTSYLAAKAATKSTIQIIEMEENEDEEYELDPKERFKERAKLVWKNYIPAGISGVATIGCIIASSKLSGNKTAAAVAAYSITEKAFGEYKEKVVEQLGEKKEQAIRDEIAQEHISQNPSREVMITSISGHVLCCELYTGRYLRSDMETLRKAENELNKILISQTFATLNDFYDLVGLSYTSNSYWQGWDSDRFMELRFSTVMSDNNEPCIAFEYNYVRPVH